MSFEQDLGALALAASDEGAARLGLDGPTSRAARALLGGGVTRSRGSRWRLVLGDLRSRRSRARTLRADVVFWDPVLAARRTRRSGRCAAFPSRRRRAAPTRPTLYTYSTATATRAALLLAGFFVGAGRPQRPEGADHRRGHRPGAPRAPARRALARAPRALERAVSRRRAAGRARANPRAPAVPVILEPRPRWPRGSRSTRAWRRSRRCGVECPYRPRPLAPGRPRDDGLRERRARRTRARARAASAGSSRTATSSTSTGTGAAPARRGRAGAGRLPRARGLLARARTCAASSRSPSPAASPRSP